MYSFVQPTALLLLLAAASQDVAAIRCYSCQYTAGSGGIGYECVTAPADYTNGASTTDCLPDVTSCQTDVTSHDNWASVYYILRGCRTSEPSGCTEGAAQRCVHTCSGTDLCNGDPIELSTAPPPIPATEEPGTRSCWSCTYNYNHPGDDDACVKDPASVQTANYVRCPPSKQCHTFRQWSKDYERVSSFRRGCEFPQANACVDEDIYFNSCNSYCGGEFCNSGDGTIVDSPPVDPPGPSVPAEKECNNTALIIGLCLGLGVPLLALDIIFTVYVVVRLCGYQIQLTKKGNKEKRDRTARMPAAPGVNAMQHEVPRVTTLCAQGPLYIDEIGLSTTSNAAQYESLGNRDGIPRNYEPLNLNSNY